MYLCISKHTYILEQGHWLGWYQWAPASQSSPMISYGDCQVRHTRPFGCPLLRLMFWPLGPAAFSREVRGNRTMTYGPIWSQKWWEIILDTHVQMVSEVMRNNPGYTSTKESWSHGWWEMVPTSIWMSKVIHWFIDLVDQSLLILTVDKDLPTGEYSWYWRSIRIHLQRSTVNCWWWIKIWDNFVVDFIDNTCQIILKYQKSGLHLPRYLTTRTSCPW